MRILNDPSAGGRAGLRVSDAPAAAAREAARPARALPVLRALDERIVACERCPRLIEHCREVARVKRASYRGWDYWGRPVPNLLPAQGEPRLLLVGLAPGAHGANRTGRMFTGDRSGDFLFRALHEAGLANQPTSTHRGDGLRLRGVAITAACHCAPPGNKPNRDELAACGPYLTETFDAMPGLRAVVTLGGLAHAATLAEFHRRGLIARRSDHPFGHGKRYATAGPTLFCAYHPSQQNTFTGRLTPAMLRGVLVAARDAAGLGE